MNPCVDRLRELFELTEDGKLLRKVACVKGGVGTEAGDTNERGYRRVSVDGVRRLAHRVVWAIHYGDWPELLIDHVNGNRSDNRIVNLRLATNSQNLCNRGLQKNSTTGFRGVSFEKRKRLFEAHIKINGKKKFLGYFRTAEEASVVYERAAQRLHGAFYYSHEAKAAA